MDTASWFSVTNVGLVAAGIGIGVVAGHFASPAIGEARRLRAELDRLLHEHESYKASVNSHFRKTAELVGQMTKSYAAVYDHLAGGARSFCDDTGPEQKLPFAPLPEGLASPVVETSASGPVAGEWPTDIALGEETDAVEEDGEAPDAVVEDGEAPDSPHSKPATTVSPS